MIRTAFQASRTRTFATSFFALTILAMLFIPSAFGQTSGTGALAGTIKDSSGGVVPNANVTVTDLGTNQSRTSTTGTDGTYRFGFLNPGHYSLQIEAPGFKTSMLSSVDVTVTETATIDGTLQIGSQSQQVEVTAEADAVQTTGATQGTVLGGSTIAEIPLTVRNYTALLGLSAGANTSVANAGALGRGTQEIATNGLAVSQNNYSMDGASVVNPSGSGSSADAGGATGMGIVNPDAIAEFKIQTSLFDAGYGRNPGASVNVVTKSGSNSFHGSAFEFFRNTVLNANDFFRLQNTAPNNSEPILNQNQYGGTFGGPIKKDKLFVFVAYQETYQKNGFTILASGNPTVPPLDMPGAVKRSNDATYRAFLGGLFCPAVSVSNPGGCPTATGGSTNSGGLQVDPAGANISQVAINLLNLKNPDGSYFIPSSPNSGYQGSTLSSPAKYEEHQAVGNLDYVINGKNTLSGRWFISMIPQSVTFGCGVTGTVGTTILPCLPDNPGTTYYKNQYINLKLTTLVSNNLVNEARLSVQQAYADLTNAGPFSNGQVGITSIYPGFLYTPGNDPLGTIIVKGNANFQFGAGLSLSNSKHTSTWEASDQISWSHGKHTIRAGFEIERDRINWNQAGVNIINLTFNTFQDFLIGRAGCPAGTAGAGAGQCNTTNLLTDPYGQPTNGSTSSNIFSTGTTPGATNPGGLIHQFRSPEGDAFIQDDLKFNSNLTLSFGLRWEYDSLVQDSQGQEVNFWPSLAQTVPVPGPTAATGTLAGWVTPANYNPAINPAPPVGGVFQNNTKTPVGHNTPLDNLAPRIGIAWRPFKSDRFVVRSGGGYFYDRVGGLAYATAIVQSTPYALTLGAQGAGTLNSSFSHPYPPTPPGWTPRFVNIVGQGTTAASTSSNLATIFIDPTFTTPTTYEWNLDTQYEIASHWVLEVAYVGSRSIRQWAGGTFAYNQTLLTSAASPYNGITTNSKANISYRVPYLGFAATGVTGSCSCTDTKFHSLQATMHKQFSHGFQFQAAYTWSRDLTDTNYATYNSPGPGNWGPATQYHPQRLTLNYSYQLPFGRHSGLMEKLANGWSLAGVTVIQDGTPLTPIDTRAGVIFGQPAANYTAQFSAGMGAANAASPAGGNDQNRLGCANTIATCPGGGWFNRTAFVLPAANGGVFPASPAASDGSTGYGNAGLGYILGPGQFNFDTVIAKNTKVGGIHEDATLEFRTELFNAFNHPQFNNPSGAQLDASKVTFGQINSESVNPRLIQFALKYVF
jgi:hypothetical protein